MHELRAAFVPAAAAEADADVGTVGDLHGALVAFEAGKDAAGNAGEFGHRRVVGVNADADIVLFGDRCHLLDEVCVVLPDFVGREPAAVGEWLVKFLVAPDADLVSAGHVKLSGHRTANLGPSAVPDAVAHVRIGGVVDTGLAQVAEILLVLFNLLVAARKVESNLRHVVDAGDANVPDGNARIGKTLFDLQESFGCAQVGSGGDADVLGAHLLEE